MCERLRDWLEYDTYLCLLSEEDNKAQVTKAIIFNIIFDVISICRCRQM